MERFSQEHHTVSPEKPAAEAIAEEQLEEALKTAKVVEDDFSVERAKLLRAQEQIEARVQKSRFQARSLDKAKPVAQEQKTKGILSRTEKIEHLRLLKRAEMGKLKKRFRDIDAHIDYPEEEKAKRRTIFYDRENKYLFVNENGKKKQITFGDIVADMDWGILYKPDESAPPDIWRRIRKISDLSEARQNIFHIFNNEIIATKSGMTSGSTHINEKFLEKHINNKDSEGFFAEKMAKSFLTRISYNNPNVLFKVEPANVIEDIQLKYDFKVYVPKKTIGVALEGEDMPREEFVKNKMKVVGIQFTIQRKGGGKRHGVTVGKKAIEKNKFAQYVKRKVDDIVIVRVPLKTYREHFKQWLDAGKPSGGPEQFLSEEDKNQLVNKVLAALQ